MRVHLTWVDLHSGVVVLFTTRAHEQGDMSDLGKFTFFHLSNCTGVVGLCSTRFDCDLGRSPFWCSRAMYH